MSAVGAVLAIGAVAGLFIWLAIYHPWLALLWFVVSALLLAFVLWSLRDRGGEPE